MRVNIRPKGYKRFNRKLKGYSTKCSFPQDVWDNFYYDGGIRRASDKESLFLFLEKNTVGEFATNYTLSTLDRCIAWSYTPIYLRIDAVYYQEKAITYELMGYISWLICRGDNCEELKVKLREQFPQYLPPSYA